MKRVPFKLSARAAKIATAWRVVAPEEAFYAVTLPDYEARLQERADKQRRLADKERELKNLQIEVRVVRDELHACEFKLWELCLDIVAGVRGNPRFGPDSFLYGAMGFVRDSCNRVGRHSVASGTRRPKRASDAALQTNARPQTERASSRR